VNCESWLISSIPAKQKILQFSCGPCACRAAGQRRDAPLRAVRGPGGRRGGGGQARGSVPRARVTGAEPRAAAAAMGTVAWAATALAFGFACKEMMVGAAARVVAALAPPRWPSRS
jgi:hypothetical protein